ncbi:hypothetical protein ACHRV1_10925 [Flavobacterium aquidurense]|uniref:hypothetical protein n=1 Tax=Flavobacterium aquidurense TaxID=362413 RepID=UPI00371C322F
MKVENQLPGLSIEDHLLEQFQVEELEKRYEFGWTAKEVELKTPYGDAQFEI